MTERENAELERLLRLPWTILAEVTPEGDRILRVAEIPSAVGTGKTEAELVADLWESLTESLRAYVHFGDRVPTPKGLGPQWAPRTNPAKSAPRYYIVRTDEARTASSASLASAEA